jgi:broad specificity phosphatase PhoE
VVDELAEYRFGPGWTWEQAAAGDDLALWRPEHRSPGGESLREFQARVDGALASLLEDPPAGRLILVVHAGVIDAVVRWAFGSGPDTSWTTEVEVAHASVTELHHWSTAQHPSGSPRHTLLVRLGDVGHLAPDLVTG